MIDGKGSFSTDQLILGEFGIWRGYGKDVGYEGSFTDEQRLSYYMAVLEAAKEVGIKNVFFHFMFSQRYNQSENYHIPDWGIIDYGGSYHPYLVDLIKLYYK